MEKTKQSKAMPWLILAIALLGIALFFYPMVSNFLAEKNQSKVIDSYATALENQNEEWFQEEWNKAVEYNQSLAGEPVRDPFLEGSGMALPQNYLEILNVDGVMGYIEIPKIKVHLPIYHGTDEDTLQRGVGHIRQTALPVGGESIHSVLTGHTGLPNAKLFTDLEQLEKGDLFFISVLDQKLAYQVDAIHVVEPNDVSLLDPVEGEDHVTLITCTPYGVNSHRLLVRGIRVEYTPQQEEQAYTEGGHIWSENERILVIMGGSALAVIVLFWVGYTLWTRRPRQGIAPAVGKKSHKKNKEKKRYWWEEEE